jgi:spore cortex formation protein SpoVR/YcgB (stage V sporulation)
MFSDYAWGGYMIYRFYPQQSRRVFLFGEADLMGDTIMNEYVDVVGLHSDWLDILNRHNVDYVVFEPDMPLTSALATQPNWHQVYSDRVAVIYVRG